MRWRVKGDSKMERESYRGRFRRKLMTKREIVIEGDVERKRGQREREGAL